MKKLSILPQESQFNFLQNYNDINKRKKVYLFRTSQMKISKLLNLITF